MSTSVTIAVALLAIHLAANEARYQKAQRRQDGLWFPTGAFARVLYAIGLPLFLCLFALLDDDWFTNAVLVGMCLVVVFTWPTTIVLTSEGVTEMSWGGLRRRRVPWTEILHAIRMEIESEREVYLVLTEGKVIKHTKQHVDRRRFIMEVGKHIEVLGGPPKVL